MNSEKQKVCFVIMGFGKKTDYESGRALDLDASYEEIIAPAAEAHGYRCIRADQILHSGVIDLPMYEMLLRADLVIADISTGNANALYELGVRHALRPRSTIIMKEAKGRLYFDLDHVNTFLYEHLGEDIGAREARRAQAELGRLIASTAGASSPDSPVYTFLPKLQQPRLSDEEYEELLDDAEDEQNRISSLLSRGNEAIRDSNFDEATAAFSTAREVKPEDTYILQRLALSTYKAQKPSKLAALLDALRIIEGLQPEDSNDPETTGLAGAIHKRLWQITGDAVQLERAMRFYRRGFEIRRDYYNGENVAWCYDTLGEAAHGDEIIFYKIAARKVREEIASIIEGMMRSSSFEDRGDRRWVFATLANTRYALGHLEAAEEAERMFHEESPAAWEISTFAEGKQSAMAASRRSGQ